MLGDTFTYGSWALAVAAVGVWLWFARYVVAGLEPYLRGLDDWPRLGDTLEEQARRMRVHRLRQIALLLTAAAAVSLAVTYAVPH